MINLHLPVFVRRLLRPLLDPYRRYRHAKLIHAVRVSIGLLATILLTTGINLPHGEWASVTMLVVIGGLQHHGNIGKKAAADKDFVGRVLATLTQEWQNLQAKPEVRVIDRYC